MPRLVFHAVPLAAVKQVSSALVAELADLMAVPAAYLVLEVVSSTVIQDGREAVGAPFVTVAWFDRGQEIQDRVAEVLTRHLVSGGVPEVDVCFLPLERRSYYENGVHF